MNSTKGAHEIT